MKRMIVLLAATTALAGCATSAPPEVAANAAPGEAVPPPAPAPKPDLGTFGFDTAGMDRAVQPGDNFYMFSNGSWARNTPIPADKSNYGMFTKLDDLSKERTRAIIEETARDPNNKIGNAYNAYLDTAAIEARGLAPIQPWLNEIKGLNDRSGYSALAAKAGRYGIGIPFGLFVGQDDKAPDRYVTQMFQSGLGMPDRDYYLLQDERMKGIRAKYLEHLTNVLNLAGEPDAPARAKALLDFETEVAKVHWTQVDSRDATKTYNLMALSKLQSDARGFDWATFLRGSGLSAATEVNVAQPSAVNGIARLVSRAPLRVLKDQLLIRSLDQYAAVLPSAFDKEAFSFYGTTLSGTPQQEERWKRAVTFTTGSLADDVSQIYVARHFPPETKAAADELVRNVVAAMGRRIDSLAWMAPQTKQRAKAKLANFRTKIGYPEQWKDYSALEVRRDDPLGNAMRAAQWAHNDNITRLGEPIRRWEWGMTPMTINAYANFGMQEIVFPAAILQPPFFDPYADPAINYGGIGAVIGHEISHHFDDQGAKYDENGRLNEWWTEADKKAFEAAGNALIAQ